MIFSLIMCFGDMTHLQLQMYWWVIVSLLAALLVFLLFVQGGQTLLPELAKDDNERNILINSLGRKWEITFTTLVTFGGAFFASFPLFYSTSFGGAYWVWMLILFSFVIQAVSYEYRNKIGNFLGKPVYDTFLFINGLVAPILIGAAVATFFTGSEFSVSKMNLMNLDSPVISRWETPFHGLEAVLNFTNVALGLALFFLARVTAILYFYNNIDCQAILERSKNTLIINTVLFLVFFLSFVGLIITKSGFAMNPETQEIFMQPYKYLNNLLEMPIVLAMFVIGVLGVLIGIIGGIVKSCSRGVWFTGAGTVLVVLAVFMLAGLNNTAFYPSTFDLQSSLTIQNASSSKFTLVVMSYVSLLVPFVFGYIWYVWKSMNAKKVSQEDIENDSMKY